MIGCPSCVIKYWIFLLSTIIPFTSSQLREIEYECGAHGRFEYCIDGIPGCVIGCHCHPGYYFDTDTKICEPNIKLTQNFRRQMDYFEPTRIYTPPTTSPLMEELTTTVRSAIDQKLDIITKDADDLGEWLYNQFFKTIENQVINETKDEGILTRRSGSGPVMVSKPSRRSHKHWRAKRKKKKKKKKKGRRSKLLRITEDDSLFDSSSGSTSDDSSDSSDSSSSSSRESSGGEKKESKDGHGHKKLLVYSKRPKLPLPSFIFLPNMETPFFPPIGLPPPPPMPMYPMVPVPPMMQYPYPGAAPHTCTNETETTTTASTTGSVSTATTHTEALSTPTAGAEINAVGEENSDTPFEENSVPKEPEEGIEEAPPALLRGRQRPRGGSRHKLMHKLRDKLKRKNKLQNFFANEYQEPPTPPFVDVEAPSNCLVNPETGMQLPVNLVEELRGLQDVDFKYLSQLIHRADLNKNNSTTPKEHITSVVTHPPPSRRSNNDNYPDITQLFYNLAQQPINRNDNQRQHSDILPSHEHNAPYQPPLPYRKKIEATNDTYYSNLGRQIATMIRNLDGEKEVDIEISNSLNPNKRPVFNGDSQRSRSYWERSIRSPFNYLKNTLKKEMRYLRNSNEHLFSLENRVEMAASTKPTLGLHELENIISKMEKAKSKLIRKHVDKHHAVPSKTSFNVNLLPGYDRAFHSNVNESQNFQSQNRQHNAYTRSQSREPPSQFGTQNNVYTKGLNGQPPSQLRLQDNVYPITQNKQSPTQGGLEKNMYTRTQSGQSLSQFVPEKYFLTDYHNISTERRNASALNRNIVYSELPTRNPNSAETQEYKIPDMVVAQRYNVANNIIQQPHKNPNTVVAQLYNNNYIQRQYENPNTVVGKQYKIPNNNFQSYAYTVMPIPSKLPLTQNMNLPFMQAPESKSRNHQLNPLMNHKNFNYYSRDNNNKYLFNKASIPLIYPSAWNGGKPNKPSYFHNELDHFDYFNDPL